MTAEKTGHAPVGIGKAPFEEMPGVLLARRFVTQPHRQRGQELYSAHNGALKPLCGNIDPLPLERPGGIT